ncbi:MAG: hypothetical protein Kow0013_05910 [Pararhodobacter sp.]
MGLFDRIERHATLVNRMADTVHADLAEALQRETLTALDLRNAVMNCVGCEAPDACEHWLEEHPAGASDTPDYCRNRELMQRLRAES